jgi:Limiting CO2-inducible proteins B/C beta carbonyic anhydrases
MGAMMSHIPDGGSCVLVYGPHVGVDSMGRIGTVDRRGKECGGSCCGSAQAAAKYVLGVHSGAHAQAVAPTDPLDAQQAYVGQMLLPYAEQLASASDTMHELPFALFQAQDKLIKQIVGKMGSRLSDQGKIALIGGIQINTPQGSSDYFLPLRFEVLSKQGRVVNDLLES